MGSDAYIDKDSLLGGVKQDSDSEDSGLFSQDDAKSIRADGKRGI